MFNIHFQQILKTAMETITISISNSSKAEHQLTKIKGNHTVSHLLFRLRLCSFVFFFFELAAKYDKIKPTDRKAQRKRDRERESKENPSFDIAVVCLLPKKSDVYLSVCYICDFSLLYFTTESLHISQKNLKKANALIRQIMSKVYFIFQHCVIQFLAKL